VLKHSNGSALLPQNVCIALDSGNSGYFPKQLSVDFCVFCEVGIDFIKYFDALSPFDDPYHLS
jgi:hypothetical protein